MHRIIGGLLILAAVGLAIFGANLTPGNPYTINGCPPYAPQNCTTTLYYYWLGTYAPNDLSNLIGTNTYGAYPPPATYLGQYSSGMAAIQQATNLGLYQPNYGVTTTTTPGQTSTTTTTTSTSYSTAYCGGVPYNPATQTCNGATTSSTTTSTTTGGVTVSVSSSGSTTVVSLCHNCNPGFNWYLAGAIPIGIVGALIIARPEKRGRK